MGHRSGIRPWIWVVGVASAFGASSTQAQQLDPWSSHLAPLGQPQASLGLQPRSVQVSVGCGASLLPCRSDEDALAARRNPGGLRWSVELGLLDLGPAQRTGAAGVRQGLNLSLVGRRPLFGSSFSVYGKLGTTYGYPDGSGSALPASLAATDSGYGVSFGAGLSMTMTPRLSATLGWDTHELRLGSGNRDSLRATSLGLQYRY